MPEPLATTADVAALWRTLTTDEEAVAESLIRIASRVIRARYGDVDDRILAGTLDAQDVADIVAMMVKRAMVNPVGDGVESQAQQAGVFSINTKFANPDANLYLTAEERLLFEPVGFGSRAVRRWLA